MFKKLMNNNGKSVTASNESNESKESKARKNPIAELEIDWITGYKSVTYDLKAFHGDFQYEINKLYEVETINPCRNGYHFCLDIENAYKNRRGDYGVRVFKVRAQVPGKRTPDGVFNPVSCAELLDLLDSDPYNFSPSFGRINNFMHTNKYVAYKIELLEEVPYEEYQEFTKVEDINTKELYQTLFSQAKYYDWKINKLATYAVENGYSSAFILEYLKQSTNHKLLTIPNCIEIITDSIKLVSLEKVSFDTRVILLNSIINQKISNS